MARVRQRGPRRGPESLALALVLLAGGGTACLESHDLDPADAALGDGAARDGAAVPDAEVDAALSPDAQMADARASEPPAPSCQVSRCPPPMGLSALFGGVACCTDNDVCGIDLSAFDPLVPCVELAGAGTLDPDCPRGAINGVWPIEGCCRPDGQCGAIDTFYGLGCSVEYANALGLPSARCAATPE